MRPPAMTERAIDADPARHSHPTVWSRLLRDMVVRAPSVGLDPARLRRSIGIDAEVLDDPDARVPLESLYALLEQCVEQTGDPAAPLRMVRDVDIEVFDAFGLLAMSSATVGDALQAMWRYARVFMEGERFTIEPAGSRVCLRYFPWGPPRSAHASMAELFARDLAVNITMLTGVAPNGVAVRLRHRPEQPERHAAWLGPDVRFGAPLDEVVHDAAYLATPLPRADPVFSAFFERYLDERLRKLPPQSLLARAREAIGKELGAGALALERVATQLATSARTLQRQLAAEGTSFTALVDEVRRSRSLALLESGASVAEVAWLLGFSEPSPFVRAFRRWTGLSPGEARRRTQRAGVRA
jgi:AraC-like DNA-binding protein